MTDGDLQKKVDQILAKIEKLAAMPPHTWSAKSAEQLDAIHELLKTLDDQLGRGDDG